MIDAETGVMWPEVKEYLEPPEARKGKEACSPGAFRGTMVLLTPDFKLPVSNTEGIRSYCLSHLVCGYLLQKLLETNTPFSHYPASSLSLPS